MRSPLRFVLLAMLIGLVSLPVTAQVDRQLPDSPVFKRRAVSAPPLLLPSDALYDIWQAFLVSRKANAGDPVAQQELGVRYLLGRGVEADSAKAAYWFFKAAEQNMISSRFNLGILLYHGWGISWNPFEAYKAFLISAEAGMHEAEFVVGLHYTENLVVPRDFAAAQHNGLAAATVAVLPVAATEQHGPHLPLSVDAVLLQGVMDAALPLLPAALPVLVLPGNIRVPSLPTTLTAQSSLQF